VLKKRIKLEHIGLIGFGFITCVVNAQAQSVVGTSDEAAASRKPRVTVALMLSGGERAARQMGNINDVYVVTYQNRTKSSAYTRTPRHIARSARR